MVDAPVPSGSGIRQLPGLIKGAAPLMKIHDVPILAAGVAFRIFLAIFPGLAAAVAVVSLITDDVEELLGYLDFLPAQVTELIGPELDGLAGGGGGASLALVLGLAGSLFAASSAAVALIKALNQIFDVQESRNVVKQRLVGLQLVLVLLIGLVALVLLVVLGPQVRRFLLPPELLGGASEVLMSLGQGVAALVILMVLFAYISWAGPDRSDVGWRWITPGAVTGVLGWLVISTGFTIYTQTFGNYGATYGAIAGVVVVLIWLQLTMTILLFGACIDVVHERRQALATAPPEPALAVADPAAAVTLPAVRGVDGAPGAGDGPGVSVQRHAPGEVTGATGAPRTRVRVVPAPPTPTAPSEDDNRPRPSTGPVTRFPAPAGVAPAAPMPQPYLRTVAAVAGLGAATIAVIRIIRRRR